MVRCLLNIYVSLFYTFILTLIVYYFTNFLILLQKKDGSFFNDKEEVSIGEYEGQEGWGGDFQSKK